MDLKEIQNLIKFVAKSEVSEVKLEMEGIKLTIKTHSEKIETTILQQQASDIIPQQAQENRAPVNTTSIGPGATETTDVTSKESKYVTIKSPIIGTFYRKSSPEKPLIVEVGDRVEKDTVVCIVEAMKLFNEIEAEVSGTIIEVLVEDSSPVEFDQPLFLVDPS